MKALKRERELAARLRAGLKGSAPPTEQTPEDLPDEKRPGATEDAPKEAGKAFNWFKEDPNEPREIVEAREIVAGLGKHRVEEQSREPAARPSTAHNELKRATRVINWLKEDVEKEHEITSLNGKPPAERDLH
jgi:hypothetical protein